MTHGFVMGEGLEEEKQGKSFHLSCVRRERGDGGSLCVERNVGALDYSSSSSISTNRAAAKKAAPARARELANEVKVAVVVIDLALGCAAHCSCAAHRVIVQKLSICGLAAIQYIELSSTCKDAFREAFWQGKVERRHNARGRAT